MTDYTTEKVLAQVEHALSVLRIDPVTSEYDLHSLISEALAGDGIGFRHEVRLGPRCRIDFMVGKVGIEVKKGRVRGTLIRAQAEKYLRFDELDALLVVTAAPVRVPALICGKPVRIFGLNRLWGVSLP